MKIIITLLTVVACTVAYTDLNNSYLNTLVSDVDALRALINCVTDKGPCDEFGQHTKEHMTEALKDGCNECDDIQKHFLHLLIAITKTRLPELYEQFEQKYDPKRILVDAVDEKIKKY